MELAIYIGLTTALVELIKRLGLNSRFAPVLSLLIGLGFAFYAKADLVSGLVIGLSASGLYSGQKAMRGE